MYTYKGRILRVVDGDTVDVEISLGFDITKKDRFRLLNINTHEIYGVKKDSEEYALGMKSTNWLKERIEGKEVIVCTYKDSRGKYGRYLCEIFYEDTNIGEEMIELDLAEYINY